jgi:hypothetical protein
MEYETRRGFKLSNIYSCEICPLARDGTGEYGSSEIPIQFNNKARFRVLVQKIEDSCILETFVLKRECLWYEIPESVQMETLGRRNDSPNGSMVLEL